jgi:hypothetical protein
MLCIISVEVVHNMSHSKTILVVVCLLVLSACSTKPVAWDYGEVIKISGNLPALVPSRGALFGNDSVRVSPDLSLVYMVRSTAGQIYTLSIYEGTKVSRALLMGRVCLGTKISFPYVVSQYKNPDDRFSDPTYLVGAESSDDIFVREPCTQ